MWLALHQLIRSRKSSYTRWGSGRRSRVDIQFSSRNPVNRPGRDELCEKRALVRPRARICSEVN